MSEPRKPVILVLEALSGSTQCMKEAGARTITVNPRHVGKAIDVLELDDFDGILLTGGGDVDPRWYGQKPHKKTYGVSEDRDLIDGYACEMAAEMHVPLLGICRGAQVMCVASGGTLKQHIEGHRMSSHPVRAVSGSILERAAGELPTVVSLHHQEVSRLAPGWKVTGHALDGTPEAIESEDGRCLGVQFHPEMDPEEDYARGIFRWLVVEACRRADIPVPKTKYPKPRVITQLPRTRPYKGRCANPVMVSWLCPQCAIRFDNEQDREDHVEFIHGMVRTNSGGWTTV